MEKQPQQWLSGVRGVHMYFIIFGALEKTFFTLEVSIVVRAPSKAQLLPRSAGPVLQMHSDSTMRLQFMPSMKEVDRFRSITLTSVWVHNVTQHTKTKYWTPAFPMRRNKSPFALRVEIGCCARSHLKFRTKGRAKIARCAWERGLLTEKMLP